MLKTAMPAPTVREVIQLYLKHSKATGLHGPQALAERMYVLALFSKHIGDMPVEECKAFHLSDWIESKESWKSVSTRRAKANMIRAAFQWAVNGERIGRNPFLKVRYAEAERRPDLPDDCLANLEHLANKQFESVLRFLRMTGCRLGELCEATWQEVDLERGVWTIGKHKSRKHTKKAKLVALVPEAVSVLKLLAPATICKAEPPGELMGKLGVPTPTDFIFKNTVGTPWTRGTLGYHLRRLKARHGLTFKASLHGIRHRFGSSSIAAGAPIKLVAQQMGHASVTTTERFYCDLSGEMDAIRKAAQLGLPK